MYCAYAPLLLKRCPAKRNPTIVLAAERDPKLPIQLPFRLQIYTGIRSHCNESYNEAMLPHIIGNPVPTPEEMAKILGVSPDRVAAVRRIMSTPKQQKASGNSNVRVRAGARKKSSRTTASRSDAKR